MWYVSYIENNTTNLITIDKKNQAEVIIAKQRNGPLGTVNLAWLGQYTKFENLEINEYDIDVSDLDDIENQ